MKNSEVLDLMMKRLGDRKAQVLRAQVLIELNKKISQLEQGSTLPWFLEDRWNGQMVANQDYVDLPADFLREFEEGRFKVLNNEGKWSPLTRVSLEQLEEETDGVDPQLPAGYAFFGEKVYFGPVPDKAYQFKLPIYRRSNQILDDSNEVTNKWLLNFFNYVTLEVLHIVATLHTRDFTLATNINSELLSARDTYWRAVEARMHTNRDYLLDNEER